MLRLIITFLLLASAAQAGPWPRGKGNQYLSFSATYDLKTNAPWQSIYYEWGIQERTTLIINQGMSFDGSFQFMAAISRDVFPKKRIRLAWAIGFGVVDGQPTGSLGLSIGRDFQLAGLNGWIASEFVVLANQQKIIGKPEFTIGIAMQNGTKVYGQVMSEHTLHNPAPIVVNLPPGPFFGPPPITTITLYPPEVRLSVSAMIPIRKNFFIDVGLSHGVQEGGTPKVKLGLVKSF